MKKYGLILIITALMPMISNAQADKKLIDKAHQGDVAAMVRLGECYENGAGVQHDSTLALQWFRKAADLGDGEAWLRISKYYLRGTLVPKDTARYFAIRKEWADKGLPNGLAALGGCYENGIGCKVDTAKANQLYQESVKKGSPWGYYILGDNYYYGICGVKEDMKKAVERLNQALGAKEKVLVYGDYDVDGTTAVALVYRYLQRFYSNVEYYIPTRDDEGYGISTQGIDYAESIGVKLIIVLDCGIKAVEEIAYAKSKGIDFIICDHHVPDDVLPDAAAILNPKLVDDKYPYKDLSGCGVGYKFMQGFAKSNGIDNMYDLENSLDLLAVSIAADLVPLTGENRILAHYGIKRLNNNPCVGLRSILRLCRIQKREITISDIIFKIGPLINASGRMQSGQESVELLVTRNNSAAYEIIKKIDRYNQSRKELDRNITEEANAIIENHKEEMGSKKPIVLYNREWHKGIIGIVASRLSELYFRPSVVLTYSNDGLATGSSRSVRGFDIYTAIKSNRDLLENFGGHTNAVGLTLKEENIPVT